MNCIEYDHVNRRWIAVPETLEEIEQDRREKLLPESFVDGRTRAAFLRCHHVLIANLPDCLLYNTTGKRYTLIQLSDMGKSSVYHFSAPNDEAAKVEAVKCLFRPVKQNAA